LRCNDFDHFEIKVDHLFQFGNYSGTCSQCRETLVTPSLERELCTCPNLDESKAKYSDDVWAQITNARIVPELFTQTLASL